jgi:hypothetical protein
MRALALPPPTLPSHQVPWPARPFRSIGHDQLIRPREPMAIRRPKPAHTTAHSRWRESNRNSPCGERPIASDLSRHRVDPQCGDDSKNGSGRCLSQPSLSTCAQRRSPSSSRCPQRRSAAGRRRACCPLSHLGRPPTLPRPGDPGPAGNPVRAILGRLAARLA